MKITEIRIIVASPDRNFVTVKVMTDEGLYGIGDATVNGREKTATVLLIWFSIWCGLSHRAGAACPLFPTGARGRSKGLDVTGAGSPDGPATIKVRAPRDRPARCHGRGHRFREPSPSRPP